MHHLHPTAQGKISPSPGTGEEGAKGERTFLWFSIYTLRKTDSICTGIVGKEGHTPVHCRNAHMFNVRHCASVVLYILGSVGY